MAVLYRLADEHQAALSKTAEEREGERKRREETERVLEKEKQAKELKEQELAQDKVGPRPARGR